MTSEEQPINQEIVTPQAVKDRVMRFFEGVDLGIEGSIDSGVLNIETRRIERQPGRPVEWYHVASVNGFEVASYNHDSEGAVSYSLIGNGNNGNHRVKYSESHDGRKELAMTSTGPRGEVVGSLRPANTLPIQTQIHVAGVVGITLSS